MFGLFLSVCITVCHIRGEKTRIKDSAQRLRRGRRNHSPGVTAWHRAASSEKIADMQEVNSASYTKAFTSKLCSKLRKSMLADPMTVSPSSMISSFEWRNPGS